jgi:hypothetical protein
VKVRIAIGHKDQRIVPDMGVRVAFLSGPRPPSAATAERGVLVPAEAVRGDGATAGVFVYADGRVQRRSITLGGTAGSHRLVLQGVRDGERVVLSPPESLKDGDAVKQGDTD